MVSLEVSLQILTISPPPPPLANTGGTTALSLSLSPLQDRDIRKDTSWGERMKPGWPLDLQLVRCPQPEALDPKQNRLIYPKSCQVVEISTKSTQDLSVN
jgi:hypothetical protein